MKHCGVNFVLFLYIVHLLVIINVNIFLKEQKLKINTLFNIKILLSGDW